MALLCLAYVSPRPLLHLSPHSLSLQICGKPSHPAIRGLGGSSTANVGLCHCPQALQAEPFPAPAAGLGSQPVLSVREPVLGQRRSLWMGRGGPWPPQHRGAVSTRAAREVGRCTRGQSAKAGAQRGTRLGWPPIPPLSPGPGWAQLAGRARSPVPVLGGLPGSQACAGQRPT